jgi:ferric-dicitrate binding protein FerR (iron transport regulator)
MRVVFKRVAGRSVRRAAGLLLTATLLNLSSPATLASPAEAVGEVVIAAALNVGGSPAVSGQTFFSGETFTAGPNSLAALSLGNKARLELSGSTVLKIDFDEAGLAGSLDAGGARLFVPEGVASSVNTAEASVRSDGGEPAVFGVKVSAEGTTVSVEAGRVELLAGGVARTVGAGEVFTATGGGVPQPGGANNLSERQKVGIVLGIGAALAAIIIAITGRGDDVEPPCEAVPVVSGEPIPPFPC